MSLFHNKNCFVLALIYLGKEAHDVHGDSETEIIERFFTKVKNTIKEAYGYDDQEADFETYKWILQNTNKPAHEYADIFASLPKSVKKNILRHMGYKTEKAFIRKFNSKASKYKKEMKEK